MPSPKMTIQWNLDHGMSCMRAGIMLLIGRSLTLAELAIRTPSPSMLLFPTPTWRLSHPDEKPPASCSVPIPGLGSSAGRLCGIYCFVHAE